MNKKIVSTLKYIGVFLLGFLTNVSGFFDNITSIPNSYDDFKKEYLYDSELLSGNWSNNTEYLLDGEELGLDFNQPRVAMKLSVDKHGRVNGEILSKRVCDTLPFTWRISMESPEPGLSSFFLDRRFYLKQLKAGKMEIVAEFKLVDADDRANVITFKRVEDRWGILPEIVQLAKNLPAYNTDFNELSDYCAGSSQRIRE